MLNTLTKQSRTSDTVARWVASSVMNGGDLGGDDYRQRLALSFANNPAFSGMVKDTMGDMFCDKMSNMLDKFDRPSLDESYYRIAMVKGKLVHVEADYEFCCRIGVTSYQFLGKELSEEFMPEKYVDNARECYSRAWNGETVDFISSGLTGDSYRAKLKPVYDDEGILRFVEVICRFTNSIDIDPSVRDEIGEFQPTQYVLM